MDTLLGNPETKNALDHMISSGAVQPFILCAATYYYDIRKKVVDLDKFVEEFRTEIMPLVEGKYRTYAETPDAAGFRASREMRAISGFSRGSMTTWFLFDKMLDVSANFLPFSGGTSDVETLQKAVEATDQDFFIYMACGGEEDTAFEGCNALAKTLAADTEHFSYGPDREQNNFFYCLSDNIHQDLTSRYYLYNAFLDGLFKLSLHRPSCLLTRKGWQAFSYLQLPMHYHSSKHANPHTEICPSLQYHLLYTTTSNGIPNILTISDSF